MTDPKLDATDLAALVRSGEVTAKELVEAAIERIERHNPAVNSVIYKRYERALEDAEVVNPDAPFAGVPILIKDLGALMEGEPVHMGSVGLKAADLRAPVNGFTYESFRDAGFIALGRTNTPEFGTTITTEPIAYGASRNPWNTDHSTGGSSGGAAASVASGMVPVAHASDGGGSIRVPASECGLVGIKPSRGRVSSGPLMADPWAGSSTDGAVTRTVRDSAAILDALEGRKTGDPYAAAPPSRPFKDEVGTDPGSLRIGICTEHGGVNTHSECVTAVESAGALLSDLGHQVEVAQPASFGSDEFADHFVNVIACSLATDFDALGLAIGRPITEDDVEPANWFFAEVGRATPAATYIASVAWLRGWSREMAAWWHDYDLLVSPVIGSPPPPIGWLSDPEKGTERLTEILQFTAQFNVTGQPAMSLPLHMSTDGLPVGVQFVAGADNEALLVRLGSQLEAAAPWADRIAPIFG